MTSPVSALTARPNRCGAFRAQQPLQLQYPPVHVCSSQVASGSHSMLQPPPVQFSMMQVVPDSQSTWQPPVGQSPSRQYESDSQMVWHPPRQTSMMQVEPFWQVAEQDPPVQARLQWAPSIHAHRQLAWQVKSQVADEHTISQLAAHSIEQTASGAQSMAQSVAGSAHTMLQLSAVAHWQSRQYSTGHQHQPAPHHPQAQPPPSSRCSILPNWVAVLHQARGSVCPVTEVPSVAAQNDVGVGVNV